ncbi:hypothetical protein [Prosthecobacter sp.]|uniref:hypothetical protein n=1 Tax=Prosthecobacter sp. TaxID=1965333 RepID=UPI002AB8E22B|nr:hypothetical protein [Prosthecobacter sp.]MDZ4406189.1 hypothetical protein [Prosthecobacter sp.]
MLEIQKAKIYERSRMRAKGVSDEEIKQAQHLPFQPAFVEGKRKQRAANSTDEVPTGQFSFRRQG